MNSVKLLAIILLSSALIGQSQYDDMRLRTLEFYSHFDSYTRILFGCPVDNPTFEPNECKINQGRIDYKEYRKAREAAKKLFELKD